MRTPSLKLIAIAALATACSSQPTNPGGLEATVTFLQADPAAPALVDLTVDGAVVAHGIAYGRASARLAIAAGMHRIAIGGGAGTFAEIDRELQSGTTYYLVSATGRLYLTDTAATVSADTGQRNLDRANIRFINIPGSNPSPALVHIYLSAPTTVDTSARFALDTRIASYSTLLYLNPGTITLRIQPADQATVLLQLSFDVARGEVKAVVLERDAAGNLTARVIQEE